MQPKLKHFITVGNKKFFYIMTPAGMDATLFECPVANIKQEFLNEDIPNLLNDLPNLIMAEKKYKNQ